MCDAPVLFNFSWEIYLQKEPSGAIKNVSRVLLSVTHPQLRDDVMYTCNGFCLNGASSATGYDVFERRKMSNNIRINLFARYIFEYHKTPFELATLFLNPHSQAFPKASLTIVSILTDGHEEHEAESREFRGGTQSPSVWWKYPSISTRIQTH